MKKFTQLFRFITLCGVLCISTVYATAQQYTLTDADVVVENGVIMSCSYDFSIKNIVIPEMLDGQTVTGITNGTTYYNGVFCNKGITSVTLPATLKSIGSHAFHGNSIASLDLSNCTALENIGTYAFYGNFFSSFALPTNTRYATIGWKSGNGTVYMGGTTVSNLETNYYVPIYTLTDADVVVENGVIISCSYSFVIRNIVIPETLNGQTVTGIGSSLFEQKSLTFVSLPATITSIGNYAFSENGLTSVSLPATITNIGTNAFYINALTSVDLGGCTTLTSIGANAFYGNSFISFTLPIPAYAGFRYWKDGNDVQYSGNTQVNDLQTLYMAYIIHALIYTAGTGGTLTGETTQSVEHGADGTTVTAVPDNDYCFVQWSDGSTDNPRTDTNVKADITVTAEFSLNTNLEDVQNGNIKIYPNPVKDRLKIDIGNTGDKASFTIFSVVGITVAHGCIVNGNVDIDLSSLTDGNYIVQIQSDKLNLKRKLILKH